MMRLLLLSVAMLTICANRGDAQTLSVPIGRRHYIVLVDGSRSMTRGSAKVANLRRAESEIADDLHDSGGALPKREMRDLVTIVIFGFDSRPESSRAYTRLRNAEIERDYVHHVVRSRSGLSRQAFTWAIRTPATYNLNVLAWAIPMGLAAASLPQRERVQETFVVLLNDAQMNDGSISLENTTLRRWLNALGRKTLGEAEETLEREVRFQRASGLPGPVATRTYGAGESQIAVTVFRAVPAGPATEVYAYSNSGVDAATAEWDRGALLVDFQGTGALVGGQAMAEIKDQDGKSLGVASVKLDTETSVRFRKLSIAGDQPATLEVCLPRSASNGMLGTQRYDLIFTTPLLIPPSIETRQARMIRLASVVVAICMGSVLLGWCVYHRWVARHFELRLPGYASPFDLPPLSHRESIEKYVRVPRYENETALGILLPSKLILRLFYRRASISWDSTVYLPCVVGNSHPLRGLPDVLDFRWSHRPQGQASAEVHIGRVSGRSRDELVLTVTHAPLPRDAVS